MTSCSQTNNNYEYLLSFTDTATEEYGYKNKNGDIIISSGKYEVCFTDTFKTYAIVLKPSYGFVAIDRQENVLYKVFLYDSGPDYPSNGLFRIIKNNKIGFANSSSGQIIIEPQFDCAFPFENGIAKVSTNCKTQVDEEHSIWVSNNWYYIDKKGEIVNKPTDAKE